LVEVEYARLFTRAGFLIAAVSYELLATIGMVLIAALLPAAPTLAPITGPLPNNYLSHQNCWPWLLRQQL
jgi:hypothetical protein